MNTVLKVEALTGGYHPRKAIIKNLSFTIHEGELIGLIGLNGAGKSTTIKHLLGLLQPHSGDVFILGKTIKQNTNTYRASLAYVPESPILYEEMTVEEHLKMTAMAYDVKQSVYESEVERLLERYRMTEKRKMLTSHLSKGMKQKVMIMSALLAKPKLLIIDEPFLGLDPLGIRSLLNQLVDLKNQGTAILMSSHILSTVEQYCDGIILMNKGEIVVQGTVEQIVAEANRDSELTISHLEEAFYHYVVEGENEDVV